jgi:hypothetical protein
MRLEDVLQFAGISMSKVINRQDNRVRFHQLCYSNYLEELMTHPFLSKDGDEFVARIF